MRTELADVGAVAAFMVGAEEGKAARGVHAGDVAEHERDILCCRDILD